MKITHAIIPVAGFGTRMLPLSTDHQAKVLKSTARLNHNAIITTQYGN